MKKRDIVERVAGDAGIAKRAAEAAVGAVLASIAEAVAHGEDVAAAGLGRFVRFERPAREGRNPCSGQRTTIAPSVRVVFQAGKVLKVAMNWGLWAAKRVRDERMYEAQESCPDVAMQVDIRFNRESVRRTNRKMAQMLDAAPSMS